MSLLGDPSTIGKSVDGRGAVGSGSGRRRGRTVGTAVHSGGRTRAVAHVRRDVRSTPAVRAKVERTHVELIRHIERMERCWMLRDRRWPMQDVFEMSGTLDDVVDVQFGDKKPLSGMKESEFGSLVCAKETECSRSERIREPLLPIFSPPKVLKITVRRHTSYACRLPRRTTQNLQSKTKERRERLAE